MDPLIDQTAWTIVVILSAFVIIGSLILVWKYAAPPEEQAKPLPRRQQNQQDQAQVVEPRQNRDGLGRMRRRRQQESSESSNEDPDQQDQRDDKPETAVPAGNLGKKKLRKLQEKEEKAKMRQAMEEAKKARIEREDREIYERKKKQQEEEEKERLEEEELERARLERKKKDDEIYANFKQFISVESDGSLLDDQKRFEEDEQGFIDYIKNIKVVFLEDLAGKYNVKTQSIVDRINALENEGKLTGIIDERGKFIYISPEEMKAVARFIKVRGRVHISEIQRESNNLIDLNPAQPESDDKLLFEEDSQQPVNTHN